MLDLHKELKALKPDEPDEEIEKDLAAMRQARPGITDEEILEHAQTLIQGGGKAPSPAPGGLPAAPASPGGPSGAVPEPPPAPPAPPDTRMAGMGGLLGDEPEAPAPPRAPSAPREPGAVPDLDDGLGPEKLGGDDAAMAALQGLAGLGDVIGSAYGGTKTDFLGKAQGAEASELAKRKVKAEEGRARRGEARDERKLDIEATKAKLEALKKAGKDTFEMERNLADDFTAATKGFQTVRDQYGTLQAAASQPSAAGDLSLIFAYMKIVDPGSTVREGEFANAQNAAGVPERVRSMWNRAMNGERLTDATRSDFVKQAQGIYDTQRKGFEATKGQFEGLADSYGLDKGRVTAAVVGEAQTPDRGAAAPSAGKVMRARNKQTGEELISKDGGKTWEPAK